MARIFMAGFEDGSLGSYVGIVGYTVSTETARTGSYCAKSGTTSARDSFLTYVFPGTGPGLYIRVGFYVSTLHAYLTDQHALFSLMSSGSTNLIFGYHPTTGALTLRTSGGTVLATATQTIEKGAWYCLEGYLLLDDAPNGRAIFKLNGDTVIDFTGDTLYTSSATCDSIRLGRSLSNVYGVYGYFDDIAINDTTGSVNNSWIGQGGVYLCPISGAGTVTGMTPSAGSNYACVDEVPASDTDYVSSADVADIDLYTIDTSGLPTPIRVDAVKLGYRAKVDAGGANLVPVLRSESTTEEQTDDALAMSTSYTVQSVNYDVDPIDDAAWDATKLAALEVGQRKGL